jgi:hypothetical protein
MEEDHVGSQGPQRTVALQKKKEDKCQRESKIIRGNAMKAYGRVRYGSTYS